MENKAKPYRQIQNESRKASVPKELRTRHSEGPSKWDIPPDVHVKLDRFLYAKARK